jgi:hypothetical protein
MPRLWVKRLVIYQSLKPPLVIRDIELHRGFNLIVGRQSEAEQLKNNPMAMAGHSVGKTGFCRLLRYCLGEERFATKTAEKRIRAALPSSWVGAEVVLDGTTWAVLRPLGQQDAHASVLENATLNELLEESEKLSSFSAFTRELATLVPPDVRHPDMSYKWEHLLAWLTRDQECRLRKFEVWRDPDSESGTSGFRKSKGHPIQLVRGLLNLIVPEESEWGQTVSELKEQRKQVEEKEKEAKFQAEFDYNNAKRHISEFIGDFPDTRNDSIYQLEGPQMKAEECRKKLIEQRRILDEKYEQNKNDLFKEKHYVTNALDEKNQIEAIVKSTPIQENDTNNIFENNSKKRQLDLINSDIAEGRKCIYTLAPLTKCNYISERIPILRKALEILNLNSVRRNIELLKINAKNRKIIEELVLELGEIERNLAIAQERLAYHANEELEIARNIRQLNKHIDALTKATEDFRHAERLCMGNISGTELHDYNTQIENLTSELLDAIDQLKFYQDQSAKNDAGLQKIFNELVKKVLKADYTGEIDTSADNFSPQVCQRGAISGAAIESLSFVLLDIAAMLAASEGIGRHPGFLVHDSPREADLDIYPYHSLFTELAKISDDAGGEERAPFQYIITTTTEPPKGLEKFVRLELSAFPETEILFRQQLRETTPLTV